MLTPLLVLATSTVLAAPVEDTTFRIARGTSIEIASNMRPVVLRTGPDNQLTVRGATVETSGSTVEIGDDDFFRGGDAPITVTVPSWATVEVDVMNAAITIAGAPARVLASTLNGSITSNGGTGVLELSTVAGAISVRGFRGERLALETISGEILVDGATGALVAASVNQRIILRNIQSSRVEVETTNGRIEWSSPLNPAGRYTFATHNGEILLMLPTNTSARVRGEMFNGTFESELPATTTGLTSSRRNPAAFLGQEFTATLGGGDATVNVETFNGSIRIRRVGST